MCQIPKKGNDQSVAFPSQRSETKPFMEIASWPHGSGRHNQNSAMGVYMAHLIGKQRTCSGDHLSNMPITPAESSFRAKSWSEGGCWSGGWHLCPHFENMQVQFPPLLQAAWVPSGKQSCEVELHHGSWVRSRSSKPDKYALKPALIMGKGKVSQKGPSS